MLTLLVDNHLPNLPTEASPLRQQTIAHTIADARRDQLWNSLEPFDRARLNAYSAQMCNRWLSITPSKTLDQHLSSAELCVTAAMQLGVDVMEGSIPCRFCGLILDTKGVHASSCTSGGDTLFRHNRVRNLIYRFSCRGQLRPELEKAGILDEDGIFVDLKRPADVLIDGERVAAEVLIGSL